MREREQILLFFWVSILSKAYIHGYGRMCCGVCTIAPSLSANNGAANQKHGEEEMKKLLGLRERQSFVHRSACMRGMMCAHLFFFPPSSSFFRFIFLYFVLLVGVLATQKEWRVELNLHVCLYKAKDHSSFLS